MHHNHVKFNTKTQSWFKNDIIHHINRMKEKIFIIILIDAEKKFDISPHPLMKQTKEKGTPST